LLLALGRDQTDQREMTGGSNGPLIIIIIIIIIYLGYLIVFILPVRAQIKTLEQLREPLLSLLAEFGVFTHL
jgi:uncharacterized membrane protein (DUF106 family)